MREEVFKDVLGYEGLYQVSNFGRVKSLKRKNVFYCGLKKEYLERPVKEKILNFSKSNRGYLQVCLTKNGKYKTYTVHRLVAKAFIDNPLNKKTVNHIDGNKLNNCVYNLEWATSSENTKHAFDNGLSKPHNQRKVNQYDLENNFIKTWNSITDFLKEKGLNKKNSGITSCCKEKQKTAYGYKWKYADDELQNLK